MQKMTVNGSVIHIKLENGEEENWTAKTPEEAQARVRVIEEAHKWLGTPFVDCCDVPGPKGGVDCAMLLMRAFSDAGVIPFKDPRPYPPNWMQNNREERFLEFILEKVGADELDARSDMLPGDIFVWRYCLTYSHGSIMINKNEMLHAYGVGGLTMISLIDSDPIKYYATAKFHKLPIRLKPTLRPVKFFSVWR